MMLKKKGSNEFLSRENEIKKKYFNKQIKKKMCFMYKNLYFVNECGKRKKDLMMRKELRAHSRMYIT